MQCYPDFPFVFFKNLYKSFVAQNYHVNHKYVINIIV